MAIDFARLRPTELARILNSQPAGPGQRPIDVRMIRRHVDQAGLQIGDGKRINLMAYAAWLRRQKPPGPSEGPRNPADEYEAIKERARARNAAASVASRDIGDIPAVVNPERRAECVAGLEAFASTYFPAIFYLPWSPDHLRAMGKMQRAIYRGGHFAHAMPRGFGKTTLAMVACLWAVLAGHRRWVCLIAASADKACNLLDLIKTWIETNPLLAEDFPEVCYPIQRLGRINSRAAGQLHHGQPTRIAWGADRIQLPTIPGSPASGAIMSACGLKGSDIRGQVAALADGSSARPDLAVIDDPQTRESAYSVLQCDQREATLAGDVMGMAGPGRDIAVFVTVTVIRKGDMADRILDRKRHPEFQGERTRMVARFPTNDALWQEYARILFASLAGDGDGSEATEFYRVNRAAMDEGAEVAWPECFNRNELSGLQHAMNWKLRDPRSFLAECQNEPEEEGKAAALLTVDQVTQKINGLPRGRIPLRGTQLTAYVDVHDAILFWLVMAWEPDFTGYAIDYGTHPKQPAAFFSQANPPQKLADVHPGASKEAVIVAGLGVLTAGLFAHEFTREDGAIFRLAKVLIDSKYETDSVKSFCRRSDRGDSVFPAQGFYLRPGESWYSKFSKKPGGQTGFHWRIPPPEGGQRYVLIDADWWKSLAAERLLRPAGDPGTWSLFGQMPREHDLFGEHCCAEQREWRQFGDAGKWHWEQKPGRPDNHWWDCLVGSAVAASMLGITLPGVEPDRKRPAPQDRPALSDLRRRSS
jgi:hypothetical protein